MNNNRIKILRVDHVLATQKQFGDMLGVSKITVGNWEIRKVMPSAKLCSKILELANEYNFDLTLEDILSGK